MLQSRGNFTEALQIFNNSGIAYFAIILNWKCLEMLYKACEFLVIQCLLYKGE